MPRKKRRSKRPPGGIRRALRIGVLVVLAGVAWMWHGIPGDWVSAWLNTEGRIPGRIECAGVRWRPLHGWRFREVAWFSPRDRVTPLFTAETLELRTRGMPGSESFRLQVAVESGSVRTELGMWTGELSARQRLEMEGLNGRLHWERGAIGMESVRWRMRDVRAHLQGELSLDPSTTFPVSPDTRMEQLRQAARALIPVLQSLDSFSSPLPPTVHVNLEGSFSDPRAEVHVVHDAPFTHRGVSFEGIRLQAALADRRVAVTRFQIRGEGAGVIAGDADLDFQAERFHARLRNTLPRTALEALSPFSLSAFLNRLQIRVEDRFDFEVEVGPSSFQKPGERVRGAFTVREAYFRDAFFPEAELALDLEGTRLRLPEFSGVIGQGRGSGAVSGSLEMDFVRKVFRLRLEGAASPDLAVSLVGPEVETLIREWEFTAQPPEFQLEVDKENMRAPLRLEMVARAEDAVWRGTLFHRIRANVSMDGDGLRIRDVVASRGGDTFAGDFSFRGEMESCTFTVDSSFPLPDLLPLMGQVAVDVLRPVRFRGPTRVSASGTVDLSGGHDHDLTGAVDLERVVYSWILFKHLRTPFVLQGQRLELPDLEGALVEGRLEANFTAEEVFTPDARFSTELEAREVDLFELVTGATDTASTPYTGRLGLDLTLEGALRDTPERLAVTTYQGEGRVEIRDGELFRIPLLLGLSRILNRVVKGFGYAAQGDFDADFVIRDGRIESENLFLGGRVLSIAGDGWYRLADRKLKANLKVQLLKDGVISDALKVLLWPIRKLIEIQLSGTLDQPDWQPRNLPKELLGQ